MKRFAWIALAGAALLTACGGVRSPDFISKLQGIQISPATSTVDLGSTTQFSAKGLYSNPPGSDQPANTDDVSGVTYTIDNSSLATISSSGAMRALKRGTVRVTASAQGFSSTATVNITGFVLTAITITPAQPVTLAAGRTQTYTATGTFSDGTTTRQGDITNETVNWATGSASVATVSPATGRSTTATALAPGGTSTTVTASATNFEGTVVTSSVTLNVDPPVLTDLVITAVPASTPQPFTIPVGGSLTFAVQGIFSDSTTPRSVPASVNPVTWTSSLPAVASFAQVMSNTQNTLTANARDPDNRPVVVTVSAPDGKGNTVTSSQPVQVRISDAVLRSITQIVAVNGTSPLRTGTGTTLQLLARGVFTDGSIVDLADNMVAWSVTNGTGQATITTFSANPPVMGGTLRGVAVGTVTVTATAASATNVKTVTAPATVTDPICVVPFTDPPATSTGMVTGGPCVPACTVNNSGNVISASQTDFAAMSISPTLVTSATLRLNVNGPAMTARPQQQAGFIIGYDAEQFSPGTDLMISVNGATATVVQPTSLGATDDGLAKALVRVPVTGPVSSIAAVVVNPALVGAQLLDDVPSLLQSLLGGTTAVEVRYYAACYDAVAPTQ